MDQNAVLELVRLGFHGAAVAMMLMGFWLMYKINATEQPTDDAGTKTYEAALRIKMRGAIFFLIVSIVVFGLGAWLELVRHSQENEVILYFSPSEMPEGIDMPVIMKGMEPLVLTPKIAAVKSTVRHGDTLNIRLEALTDRVDRLQALLNEIAAQSSQPDTGADDV